ncbi:hypothetical protein B296_00052454, partial [Ensete ventricosum]
ALPLLAAALVDDRLQAAGVYRPLRVPLASLAGWHWPQPAPCNRLGRGWLALHGGWRPSSLQRLLQKT